MLLPVVALRGLHPTQCDECFEVHVQDAVHGAWLQLPCRCGASPAMISNRFPTFPVRKTAKARHAFGLPSPFQGSPGKISISRVRTLSAAASMSHS